MRVRFSRSPSVTDGERSLAIFVDFENLARGFSGRRDRFDIARVLERLVEKGKVVVKKAYADWGHFQSFTQPLHEAAIELIEIPQRRHSGKNSADIRLCVDAMDLAYSKDHIDTFVVVSGDSDFSPLVSKLKELGKHVIGLGMQDSTSDLLRDNCDEFIYYEDLGQSTVEEPAALAQLPDNNKRKAFALLLESLHALQRENKEVMWSSMIKDTMKRKKPSFNETFYGYRTFSELLEDAQQHGLVELETDARSKTYVVTRFGETTQRTEEAPPPPSERPPVERPILASERVERPTPSSTPTAAAPPASTATGPAQAPKKKSRRRRRRGPGVNGNGAPVPVGPSTGPAERPPVARPGVVPMRVEVPSPTTSAAKLNPPEEALEDEPDEVDEHAFDAGLSPESTSPVEEAPPLTEAQPEPTPEPAETTPPTEEPAPKKRTRQPQSRTTKPRATTTTSRSRTKKEKPAEETPPPAPPARRTTTRRRSSKAQQETPPEAPAKGEGE